MDIDSVDSDGEKSMATNDKTSVDCQNNELLEKINTRLPIELRGDFLRLLAGTNIPRNRREKVQAAVKVIIDE